MLKKLSGRAAVMQHMQEAGKAGRPEIAAATGLSHVMVRRIVQQLCAEGLLTEAGYEESRGGRKSVLYRYEANHAVAALFRLIRNGTDYTGTLEYVDLQGNIKLQRQTDFRMIQAESIDEWLSETASRRRWRPSAIMLNMPPEMESDATVMAQHLETTQSCPVSLCNTAEALDTGKADTLTLVLEQGRFPVGVMHGKDNTLCCNTLHALPLPAHWQHMNHEDHTLVEEMVSRLLQITACTLQPQHITIYSNFWTERLITRVHYNTSAKLKNLPQLPHLDFRELNEDTLISALRKTAGKLASTPFEAISNLRGIMR